MKDILQHINSVDGVMGSALCSDRGEVLAHVFPPLFDEASLTAAASMVMEFSYGLQMTQSLDVFDFRYADGRVIVKAFPESFLILLCAANVNFHVLSITLNLAIKKLSEKRAANPPVPQPAPAEAKADDGILRMAISHLANKQASASFDSLGMVALSQATSQYITDFYKTPFKKVTMKNIAAGTSGTFPVMVMKDMDQQYDGTVVVGPGIEKKLQVSAGDKVEVTLG